VDVKNDSKQVPEDPVINSCREETKGDNVC